jgi:hypothetical protein
MDTSRKWQHFKSSELDEGDHTKIADALAEWRDPTVDNRHTVYNLEVHNDHTYDVSNLGI